LALSALLALLSILTRRAIEIEIEIIFLDSINLLIIMPLMTRYRQEEEGKKENVIKVETEIL